MITERHTIMGILEKERIREAVRQRYGKVATKNTTAKDGNITGVSCCSPSPASDSDPEFCNCSSVHQSGQQPVTLDSLMGYSPDDIKSAPEGANMGLGCGNPVAMGLLKPGETVVDLGSGGGFDCFLAADKVSPGGRVIGVDMTPEMIGKARRNAQKAQAPNVEFRLGEIEHLPVADNNADIILSNCVINLSADKIQVYKDAFRVLKPGGRLAISDILATAPLPPEIQQNLALVSACVGGAATLDDTREMLESAGFVDIRITPKEESREVIDCCLGGGDAGKFVVSAYIEAKKPL